MEEQEYVDPYSPENIGISQFVVQARIYDVLMAVLRELNGGVAKDVLEAHARGVLIGPAPVFEGDFATDIINDTDSSLKTLDPDDTYASTTP